MRWFKLTPAQPRPLRPADATPTVDLMAGSAEFRTGDLAEVLSGPFRQRLGVILRRYADSELWLVAIYYPSGNSFVHTYLDERQLKVIGHLEET